MRDWGFIEGLSLLDTMTLGELRDKLMRAEEHAEVRYDFTYMVPTTLDSYRGYYDQLALGYGHYDDQARRKARDLVTDLQDAIGKTFEGWKGGSFKMHEKTRIYVANPGEAPGTGIVHVTYKYDTLVILHTMRVDG